MANSILAQVNPSETTRKPYDRETGTRWLAWLASGMERHGEQVLLVENLQPTWMVDRSHQWWYVVISRLIAGPILIPIVTLYWGWTRAIHPGSCPVQIDGVCVSGVDWMVSGIWIGLIYALTGGVLAICVDWSRARHQSFWKPWIGLSRRFRTILDIVLVVAVFTAVSWVLTFNAHLYVSWNEAFRLALFFGLVWAVRGTHPDLENDIRPVERLTWSWPHFWHWPVLLIGLLSVMILGLALKLSPLTFLASLGLMLTIVVNVTRAVRPGLAPSKSRPNEGIHLSFRSVGYAFICFGLLGAGALLATTAQSGSLAIVLEASMGFVYGGLIGAAWFGGLDVMRHYILRLVLSSHDVLPLHLVPFLNFTADRLQFLQRVGGGYLFVHRYLQQHLAGQGERAEAR